MNGMNFRNLFQVSWLGISWFNFVEIINIEKMRRSFSEPVCQMNNMKYHFI